MISTVSGSKLLNFKQKGIEKILVSDLRNGIAVYEILKDGKLKQVYSERMFNTSAVTDFKVASSGSIWVCDLGSEVKTIN